LRGRSECSYPVHMLPSGDPRTLRGASSNLSFVAKALMTADHRFDGYRMPPLELSAAREPHPAASEALRNGIAKPEKGVFAVGEVEPRS
jgi:hypothetical protein